MVSRLVVPLSKVLDEEPAVGAEPASAAHPERKMPPAIKRVVRKRIMPILNKGYESPGVALGP